MNFLMFLNITVIVQNTSTIPNESTKIESFGEIFRGKEDIQRH